MSAARYQDALRHAGHTVTGSEDDVQKITDAGLFLYGTPRDIHDGIARFAAAGVDEVVLNMVGADGIRKTAADLDLQRRTRQSDRLPRAERRGQVHHHAHDPRPGPAHLGHRPGQRRALPADRAPLIQVGALLDAKAVHGKRSAEGRLRALATSNGLPAARVGEVLETVGLTSVAKKGAKGFSLGMGQRLGIAAALLGSPATPT